MAFQQRFGKFRRQAHAHGFSAKEWAQINHAQSLIIAARIFGKGRYDAVTLACLMAKMTDKQKAAVKGYSP